MDALHDPLLAVTLLSLLYGGTTAKGINKVLDVLEKPIIAQVKRAAKRSGSTLIDLTEID